MLARAYSDCGILLPRQWAGSIVDEKFGSYWCAVVVRNLIFISAHILDHGIENGRAEAVFYETVQYVQEIRDKYSNMTFEIILGVDANVTLMKGMMGVSGNDVLSRTKGHYRSAALVANWFQCLGLRAMNTFLPKFSGRAGFSRRKQLDRAVFGLAGSSAVWHNVTKSTTLLQLKMSLETPPLQACKLRGSSAVIIAQS